MSYLTTNKERNLTEKQQSFLDNLVETKGDFKKAAELAGYSGNHYQVIQSLKEEIIDLASNVLAREAPSAAFKLVEIMHSDEAVPQANVKLQAAQTLLDRVGVINQGEIIVVEETKELLKKMGHKKLTVYLQNEISNIPDSLNKYNLILGKNKISLDYTYNVRAEQTGITNLLQDLKDAGLKLKDLKTEQSTLEKIFVSLVKENNEI